MKSAYMMTIFFQQPHPGHRKIREAVERRSGGDFIMFDFNPRVACFMFNVEHAGFRELWQTVADNTNDADRSVLLPITDRIETLRAGAGAEGWINRSVLDQRAGRTT